MKYLFYFSLILCCCACGGDDDGGNGPGGSNNLTDWAIYSQDQGRTGNSTARPPRELPSVRWEADLGAYGKSSPVLYENKVYTAAGDNLFCLDASNGSVIWEKEFADNVGSLLSVFDDRLYAGDDNWNFVAIDPATGNDLWRVRLNGDIRSAPCHASGIVYISDDTGGVYALNANDGTVVWALDLNANGVTMALADNRLYFLSNRGITGGPSQSVLAVNTSDGAVIWQTGVAGFAFNSPAISGNTLVLGTKGHVYALNRTSGAVIWDTDFSTALEFHGSPAIADGFVYIGSQTVASGVTPAVLAKLDIDTGNTEWTRTINENRFGLNGAPVVAGGVVIAVGDQTGCLAWDADSGDLLWNFTPSPGFAGASAIVSGDQVFYLDVNRKFYRLGE